MPSFPEHGPGPSLLDAIVVDPGGAIGGVLAFHVEREPVQGRRIARKVRSDARGGSPAVIQRLSNTLRRQGIERHRRVADGKPARSARRIDALGSGRPNDQPSDGPMSRNRCATWAVRPNWSSHHVHRLVRAARGNRSLSVTSMKMLRSGPIGELYHHPTSTVSTTLRVLAT